MVSLRTKSESPAAFSWPHGSADEIPAVQQALQTRESAQAMRDAQEQRILEAKFREANQNHDTDRDAAVLAILAGAEPETQPTADFKELRRVAGLLDRGIEIRTEELKAVLGPAVKQISTKAVDDDRRLVGDLLKHSKAMIAAFDALQTFRSEFRRAASVAEFTVEYAVAPMADVQLNQDVVMRFRAALDQFESYALKYVSGKGITE